MRFRGYIPPATVVDRAFKQGGFAGEKQGNQLRNLLSCRHAF